MTKTSVTEEFLKDRIDANSLETLETGVWYSGFDKVKKHAEDNKIPFFAVWSNGDDCGLCKKMETNMMTDVFRSWMKTSNVIFWFGHSKDVNDEDRVTGKKWTKNSTLKYYPFARFHWEDGKNVVDCTESGSRWNKSKAGDEGAKAIIETMEKYIDDINSFSSFSCEDPTGELKIRLNPDWTQEDIDEFREKIKKNGGYCPCGDENIEDTKCMCKWFREQEEEGDCHCGLYNKYYVR